MCFFQKISEKKGEKKSDLTVSFLLINYYDVKVFIFIKLQKFYGLIIITLTFHTISMYLKTLTFLKSSLFCWRVLRADTFHLKNQVNLYKNNKWLLEESKLSNVLTMHSYLKTKQKKSFSQRKQMHTSF